MFLRILQFFEKKRIQLHLMRTEYWMRSRDTSHLDFNLKQKRSSVLKLLHEYWKKGEFPINTTHRERIPQIKDQSGTPCALAYILQNSGRKELVENIAQENNYVYVNDVPNDHPLNYAIKEEGFSKKEAAQIQPSYSCRAIVGPIQTGDPFVEFLAIILCIAGSATALSFYFGINHVSNNFDNRTIRIAIIFGVIVLGTGITMTYQNSMAEPFGETNFQGNYGTVNVVDDISIYYWVEGGEVKEESDSNYFVITPTSDGQITIAYPPIITEGYENYYQDNYYSHAIVLLNGEEIETTTYSLKGYQILTINFSKSDSLIEIIGNYGLCGKFIFEEKPNP